MCREDIIRKGFAKVKRAYDKLNSSRDMDYTQELVKITSKLSLEVNCIRNDEGEIGQPLWFEFYVTVEGNTVDGDTVHNLSDIDKEIMYLLNCYA